ncbi:hypothetical protein GIB67_031094 [Kingdonia uniflora]|uniref:Uncharacterized protein n=1 Tax=Kingdonia uniflora TaxID=39325 RepID=A0A7J7P2F7_9MAGN|nr:hypothetical protein GIB67_031094 [Kingdonia uniflora]
MGMMTKGNVWITTHIITAQLDSLTPQIYRQCKGSWGFRRRFHSEHPHEANLEPGRFGQQAYDATWALALAMEGKTIQMGSVDYLSGRRLSSPRGWTLPMNESRLKIGVPAHSTFNQLWM